MLEGGGGEGIGEGEEGGRQVITGAGSALH